jgi:hypothetical protein
MRWRTKRSRAPPIEKRERGTIRYRAPAHLGASFSAEEKALFPWYKYLFMDGSKPVAHMRAMVYLKDSGWHERAPEPLVNIKNRTRLLLGQSPKGQT